MNALPLPHHSGDCMVVVIDYTNGSAQVVDISGQTVAIYGPGVTRTTLADYIHRDGWRLTPGGVWTETSPPDGRKHPIYLDHTGDRAVTTHSDRTQAISAARAISLVNGAASPKHATPLRFDNDLNAPDSEITHRTIEHFGSGSTVLGITTFSGPHPMIHRATITLPRLPHCATTSHGTPSLLIQAVAVTEDITLSNVFRALDAAGIDRCRVCRRCWRRQAPSIPSHSRRCFHKSA